MHSVTLFFEPLDVLVFRDHRPFVAGQHFLARGVYPLPSVFFGAVRAALFETAGVRFRGSDPFADLSSEARTVLGDADHPGQLELAGPLLARRGGATPLEVYLPWPRDLDIGPDATTSCDPPTLDVYPVYPTQRRSEGLRCLGANGDMAALDGSLPTSQCPSGKPSKRRYFLTTDGAARYANACAEGKPGFQLIKATQFCAEDCLLIRERRTGIARTRVDEGVDPLTVDESMFFTVETWRFAGHVGFAVDVSLSHDAIQHTEWLDRRLQALDGLTVRLGGKGHLARVHRLDRPLLADLDNELRPPRLPAGTSYKAWNLTPSLLDPATADPRPTMVLGDALRLGGINLRKGKDHPIGPRPLIGALAPGSVLHYEDARDLNDLGHRIRIANERGEKHGHHRRAGYGIHRLLPYRRPHLG